MAEKFKKITLRKDFYKIMLVIAAINITFTFALAYAILNNSLEEINQSELQRKNDAILGALDYAVSHETITTEDIHTVLKSKILEIADVNKQDIVIYDLKGQFIISNQPNAQVEQIKIPPRYLEQIITKKNRLDIQEYDEVHETEKTSTYSIITNNFLEPIGIVYLPYFHNSDVYSQYIKKYLLQGILVIVFLGIIFYFASGYMAKKLTRSITRYTDKIQKVTLFQDDFTPLRYYDDDELGELTKAYNKMILQIQEQRERLAFNEKEKAWREMAKQVAHEVKTPLTPMRLRIQNFAQRFDPSLPDIRERVNNMANSVIGHIDTVSAVASAFSQFAQLPERKEEVFDLVQEVNNILNLYNDAPIHFHHNKPKIEIKMDKVYLHRILTNLITNARKASEDAERPIINVDIEQINKRVRITVEDFGIGIPKEMHEQIFQPSFSTKTNGMGLGLTMVKKMVEGYGGEISLQSQVGVGTKFFISLPTNI